MASIQLTDEEEEYTLFNYFTFYWTSNVESFANYYGNLLSPLTTSLSLRGLSVTNRLRALFRCVVAEVKNCSRTAIRSDKKISIFNLQLFSKV